MNYEKLYIVVRGDLAPGDQAVQAVHAARQFAHEHREREARWFVESNHLAFLSVPKIEDLLSLKHEAARRSILSSSFEEEDMGGVVTAVTFAPEARRLCANLGLALKSTT